MRSYAMTVTIAGTMSNQILRQAGTGHTPHRPAPRASNGRRTPEAVFAASDKGP